MVKLNSVYHTNHILICRFVIDQKKLHIFDPGYLEIPLVIAAKPDGSTTVLATIRDNRAYVALHGLENESDNDKDEDTTEWGIAVPTIDEVLAGNAKKGQGHRKETMGGVKANLKYPLAPISKPKAPRKELIVTLPPSDDEMLIEPRAVRPLPRRPMQNHIHTPQRPTKRPRPNDASDETPEFNYRFIEDVEPTIQQHRRHVSEALAPRNAIRPTHSRHPSYGVVRNVAGQQYHPYAHPAGIVVPHGTQTRHHVRFAEDSIPHDDMHKDLNYTGRPGYGYQDDIYRSSGVPGPSRRR